MSGGVDSSVSAYLLKKQGYDVVGLFMKNWEGDPTCDGCSAVDDFNDVARVCEKIGIPYYSINFADKYMDRVFKHFLKGLNDGITPNPDILCNREIKFGPFLDFADKIGADMIATGHYAKVSHNDGIAQLLKSKDTDKDQTYFLCALSQKQLSRVIFPLGEITKPEVRKIATKLGLVTADKKDSTGICFVGERKFRDFMHQYFGDKQGNIVTLGGEVVGKHKGLVYYTIGQRKGLGIGATDDATDRWFVVKKDVASNTLVVNNGECPELFSSALKCREFNWITPQTDTTFKCNVKVRYRQPDQPCTVTVHKNGGVKISFDSKQRAVTPGQWAVLYDGEVCLGGGEITEVFP